MMNKDDVMIKRLLKVAFDDSDKNALDAVSNQNVLARFWINQSRTGRKYLHFSLHCFARIKGQPRWVNSFQPDDVEALPGLAKKIASWLAQERSTSLDQRKRLEEFVRIQERFETLRDRFRNDTADLLNLLVDLTSDRKDVKPFLNSLRKLQEHPKPFAPKRPSPKKDPVRSDGEEAMRLMKEVLEALVEEKREELRSSPAQGQVSELAKASSRARPKATHLNGG